VTQEKVFSGNVPAIKLAVTGEQILHLVTLASKLQKMSQKRAIYSLITILIRTPKPFQSDLSTSDVVKAAVAIDPKTGLYLQTLLEGGLSEEVLQNLIETEVNSTPEGIEVLRVVWMNLH
jgi:hypothetical protein